MQNRHPKIKNISLDNPVILAPMAGISDLPYRLIHKRFGAALVTSEMVSANGLIRNGKRTLELVRSRDEERPLSVQLFGDDPEVMARGAAMVEPHAQLIDINMGCPVKKVIRSGAGCALMKEPQRIARMIAEVRRATDLPLSVKIRSGWDAASVNFLEIGRIAQEEGADAITLHPRTRAQGFGGHSNWEHLRALKEALAIPVIGSGDIYTVEDALEMHRISNCDAFMIGRGGYGNPWLVRDLTERLAGRPQPEEPSDEERLGVALEHLELATEVFPPAKALADMRKHLCWYTRGCPGSAGFRAEVNRAPDISAVRELLLYFFDPTSQNQSA